MKSLTDASFMKDVPKRKLYALRVSLSLGRSMEEW